MQTKYSPGGDDSQLAAFEFAPCCSCMAGTERHNQHGQASQDLRIDLRIVVRGIETAMTKEVGK